MEATSRARLILGIAFAVPFSTYIIYNMLAPGGVMHNHRASAGAYMWFAQNFMGPLKTYQQIYRPEFALKEAHISLHKYSKKIENLKKEGSEEVVQDVHHPKAWH